MFIKILLFVVVLFVSLALYVLFQGAMKQKNDILELSRRVRLLEDSYDEDR